MLFVKKVPLKLKKIFCYTAIRHTMMYGTECWIVRSHQENKLHVAKMRMLNWMSEHIRLDRIRNECIREKVGITLIVEKIVESCLRWFGYM